MKRILIFILAIAFSLGNMQARKFIINCSSTSNPPVTIYAQGRTYYLTQAGRSDREGPSAVILYTEGNRDLSFSAYDKDGNRITQITRNNKTDSNGNIEYTRIEQGGAGATFKKAEPSSGYSSYGNDDYADNNVGYDSGYDGGYTDNRSGVEQALSGGIDRLTNTVTGLGQRISEISNGPKVAGYPYLSANFGMSRLYGEYARLKVCWGSFGGFYLHGGVGKDWVWKGDNRDQLSWHVGIGYYIAPSGEPDHEISFGTTYSQTPVVEGGALALDVAYTYFLPATNYRLGFFGGTGIGIGNLKAAFATKTGEHFGGVFVWDVSIGISIKLFASNRSDF